MSNDTLINVEHLSRYYGDNLAVNDISFQVGRGEVIGFLGPNGAGKTTTMQIISGNLAPSAGQVQIHGIDILDAPKLAKAELGYLPEQPPVYRELAVDEYLEYCARINRIPRMAIREAVGKAKQRCGLGDVGRRLIGNLSKGYRQRVGIAQAIIHSPAVVILDEPTVGLDPIQIREIRALIRELSEEHSVILSTHILPEVQTTCDRVLIINRGEIALADSIEGLNARMQARSLVIGLHRPPPDSALAQLDSVEHVEALEAGRFRVHFSPATDPASALADLAASNDWGLYELVPERMTLEQIFVDITCKDADDAAAEKGDTT